MYWNLSNRPQTDSQKEKKWEQETKETMNVNSWEILDVTDIYEESEKK